METYVKKPSVDIDKFSFLPSDTVEKIFDLITVEDIAKFGTLSRDWRKYWCSGPRLILDGRFFEEGDGNCKSLLLQKLSGIKILNLDGSFLKALMPAETPGEFSSVLCSLKHLFLRKVSFDDPAHLSSSLDLVRSSPNLQTLHIQAFSQGEDAKAQVDIHMLKLATTGIMPQLRTVKIFGLRGLTAELILVGTIITSSPLLETLYLEFDVDKWQYTKVWFSLNNMARASRYMTFQMRIGDFRSW